MCVVVGLCMLLWLRADVAIFKRAMVSPVVCPRLFPISHLFDIQSTARNHIVSTPFQTIVEEDTQKIVTHVSVQSRTFHETHYPLPPPGNPNTIQYLIPGRATNVELLKQVKNWQSPLRDPWSNCPINSREPTKSHTNYWPAKRQVKDNLRKRRICSRIALDDLQDHGVLGTFCFAQRSRCVFPMLSLSRDILDIFLQDNELNLRIQVLPYSPIFQLVH